MIEVDEAVDSSDQIEILYDNCKISPTSCTVNCRFSCFGEADARRSKIR